MKREVSQGDFCFFKTGLVRVNFPARMICREGESHESGAIGGNNKPNPRDIEESVLF